MRRIESLQLIDFCLINLLGFFICLYRFATHLVHQKMTTSNLSSFYLFRINYLFGEFFFKSEFFVLVISGFGLSNIDYSNATKEPFRDKGESPKAVWIPILMRNLFFSRE